MSERNKRTNSARAKRRELLDNMKKVKEGGVSRTSHLELDEGKDVFELLDDDQYQKLVEERRKTNDFVVDDENLGYFDDGEEHIGVMDDAYEAKKRAQEAVVESKAYKKARRLGAASSAGDKTQKNTMFNFVRTGQSTVSNRQPSQEVPDTLDLDNLLDSMGASSKPRTASSHRPRVHTSGSGSGSGRETYNYDSTSVEHDSTCDQLYEQQHGDAYDIAGGRDDWGEDHARTTSSSTPTVPLSDRGPMAHAQKPSGSTNSVVAGDTLSVESQGQQSKISLTQTSKKLHKPARRAAGNAAANADSATDGAMPLLQPVTDYFSEVSSTTGEGGADAPMQTISSTTISPSAIDPSAWLQRAPPTEDGEPGEEYVPMFWTDATEAAGVVYLFGKVAISQAGANKAFVSCCVAVHGCERNLFVLPKKLEGQTADGTPLRASMSDVYGDLSRLLVPNVIPRSEGRGFRCKAVKRRYAFEFGDVPRNETEYMKVVYSAKHGTPNPAQCSDPGRAAPSIERIFGASISVLEWFLLKRKLMGPGWIRIRRPRVLPSSVSWCKVEVGVEDPKSVEKMPASAAPPAPALTTMSISMKTAVNPSTHVHEVIALSAVVHTKVDLDGDSAVSPSLMKRFTLIRQLQTSCGPGYPASFPHDMDAEVAQSGGGAVITCANERALLSAFFTKLHVEDPDVLVSHNLFGFEFDVLLSRAVASKIPTWNKIGRLRRTKIPKGISDRDVASGRLLCDTYKAAKEFLRETTYSLTHLASSQLHLERTEVDPMDVPRYFSDSKNILRLAVHTMNDAFIVQALMLKLQVVPLTKQLTNISGNLWARTMRGARAERIEYLLLHEFHTLKYILPERKGFDNSPAVPSASKKGKKTGSLEEMGEEEDVAGGGKVGGHARSRAKAAYAGGLVLEPKKGLYDTFVLLLDFNSLYPSLIQEYNLCFTTVEWTKFMPDPVGGTVPCDAATGADDEEGLEAASAGQKELPPVPDSTLPQGVLPRVIKTLVDRRREVKTLLKKAKEPSLYQQLDIRQKALKLTANTALVTAKGREALQRTVDQATTQMALDVIYGDTDSVMINTNSTDLAQVKSIGQQVTKEVNKLYKSLELDIDGIYKSMLLLKKKKYAAVTINEKPDGSIVLEKELKGLDLVRRDWCPLSKNTGKFVVDKILSGEPRDDIVQAIHEYLGALATSVRNGDVELAEFVVTKGLNKSPKDYPDVKGQPHLQVALQLLKANKPVNIGDHIPYVICKGGEEKSTPADRAHHPDEVMRSKGELTVDYEWYLSQQILPPISRLCEPIEGTSPAIISQQLGLDIKYAHQGGGGEEEWDMDGWGFTPKSRADDAERFKKCQPLRFKCLSCKEEHDFPGVFGLNSGSGLICSTCGAVFWGRRNAEDCFCYVSNRVTLLVRECVRKYYDYWLVCDDHTCRRRTKQQSVLGFACTENCHGRMVQEYDDSALHNQLKYLESLFDVPRSLQKRNLDPNGFYGVPLDHQEVYKLLKQHMENAVNGSAYNWVRPSLWSAVFGDGKATAPKAQGSIAGV